MASQSRYRQNRIEMTSVSELQPRGGVRGLLDKLDAVHAAGDVAVLGIVVATEGSTYQKPGALVLLGREELQHGVISGGCLEGELVHRARAVFDNGRAALVDFDTRSDEDLVFGSGTGCRGRVHLLLLPQPRGAPLAQALRQATHDGASLTLKVALEGEAIGAGEAPIAEQDSTGAQRAWQWNGAGAPGSAMATVACAELKIAPPPRVLLLGAGPETPPLLDFIRHFGWFVTVVEHRGRWSAFAKAELADCLLALPPSAAVGALAGERADAAIAMSHNYALDAQYLRFCAQRDIGYVGLLGPPARRDTLLAELGSDAESLRPRLHAPVGLDLGGSGPEAIALAIVAELQRFFANKPRG
jgi:xanthine/CO dehydrogenase XdhC/CoxF family maturation factor